jgi:hypothetical protein
MDGRSLDKQPANTLESPRREDPVQTGWRVNCAAFQMQVIGWGVCGRPNAKPAHDCAAGRGGGEARGEKHGEARVQTVLWQNAVWN